MLVNGAVLRLHIDPLLRDGRSASVEMPPEALPKALAEALVEVRSYLPAAQVPDLDESDSADLPGLLAGVVLDLATWQLTLAYQGPVPLERDSPVQLRYDRSRKVLNDLAAGRAQLPGAPAQEDDDFAIAVIGGGYGSNGYGPWENR